MEKLVLLIVAVFSSILLTPVHAGKDCRNQVDGGWSDFGDWSECSTVCGDGLGAQSRSRTCTNPTPAYGGAYCKGGHSETETCNPKKPCISKSYCGSYCKGNTCYRERGDWTDADAERKPALEPGESVYSHNRKLRLTMEYDGRLVIYCGWPGISIWESVPDFDKSAISGATPKFDVMPTSKYYGVMPKYDGLYFQDDQKLVVNFLSIRSSGSIWASAYPDVTGGSKLVMQDDGTLHMYADDGTQLGGSKLVMQDDGNLVMYTDDGTQVWKTDTAGRCTDSTSRMTMREVIQEDGLYNGITLGSGDLY